MSNIDAILYINLEHRVDRKEHILNEINKLGKDASCVHRIDAVKHTNGALGCSLSHIKALQYALDHPEWRTVLILEDDFTFYLNHTDEIVKAVDELCNHSVFDVCQLSYNPIGKFVDTTPPHMHIKKIMQAQTSSGYIITKTYIPTLLQNLIESSNDMQKIGRRHSNCLDIYWFSLQSRDNWFCIFPAIGYQYNNYSDIEKCYTSYGC
jgi:GR25 family glycosyltransferase involved in LPS biosynthesis